MTRHFTSSKSNYLPVVFRIYSVDAKGMPLNGSIDTVQLERCIIPNHSGEKYESVAFTIKRLRDMLKDTDKRFSIVACEESADERTQRRQRDNLEVVAHVEEPKVELSASMQLRVDATLPITPITKGSRTKSVDDESLGVRLDNGRHATVKRAVANKSKKAA